MRTFPGQSGLVLAAICTLGVPTIGAAQRSCAPDSAGATLGYQLINTVLLRKASRLADTLESDWLAALGMPVDSGPAEVRRRWADMWRVFLDNCATVPDTVRVRFARHLALDAPLAGADPASPNRYVVKVLYEEHGRYASANIGPPDRGLKYDFSKEDGRWRITNMPRLFPYCPAAPHTRRLSGTLAAKAGYGLINGGFVVVRGSECGTSTDSEGRWSLAGAPPTSITLNADFIGYTTASVSIPGSAKDSSEILIELEEQVVDLDAIVLTAATEPETWQPLLAAFVQSAFSTGPIWWSSAPFFVLYDNGIVIYRSERREQSPAYAAVSLSPRYEVRPFLDSLQLEPAFFQLDAFYDNIPGVYDLPIYTLWAWRGDSGKFVSLTGALDSTITFPRVDPKVFHERTPARFVEIYRRLTAFSHPQSTSWREMAFEIVLSGAGSVSEPMPWPLGWPTMESPGAFKDESGDLHIPFTPPQVAEYLALYEESSNTRVFSLGGKKWSSRLRPVLPGDQFWRH